MFPIKDKQFKTLQSIGCEDLAKKVNEIVRFLNTNGVIETEDYIFGRDYVKEIKEKGVFYSGNILISEEQLKEIFK